MPRPNILFLLSDEHGFRWLGHRDHEDGGESVLTPALDSLAATGSQFRAAYCQMPLCTPSRLSLLSGLEPRACGAWSNESVLRPELPTVASILGDAGYRTALIGKMHLGGTNQYAGFQDRPYGDLSGKTGHQWEPIADSDRHSMRARTAKTGVTGIPESLLQDQVVAQETVAWIREVEADAEARAGGDAPDRHDAPWFALASFSRPHFPLTAPARWVEHYRREGVAPPRVPAGGDAFNHPMSTGMRAGFQAEAISDEEAERARIGYAACVSYLDEVMGDLFARLQASDSLRNTIIVYTADHGEMAGEHGVWWKNGWYEACTRVPLLVSTPEQRTSNAPPTICETPVGLVDLVPTLCSLAGVEPPEHLHGRDLAPAIDPAKRGTAPPPDATFISLDPVTVDLAPAPVACDALTPRWGEGTEFRAVRYGEFKYVRFRNAPPLLFCVTEDPGEQENLLAPRSPSSPDDPHEWDPETVQTILSALPNAAREAARFANESIDFDDVGQERTVRDGKLDEEYAHGLPPLNGNLYIFPSGELVDADGPMLYDRTVVRQTVNDLFTGKGEAPGT